MYMSTAKRLMTEEESNKYLKLRDTEKTPTKANKYLESLQEELWNIKKKKEQEKE